ncbi:amidohydrolase [Microbacterium candidum]|uniref:Amidohydrolase n=1 Tax=Microbacterium candidum TaxID=3041922 RepID=A0ABT7MXA6_9MICO|nr:amidohydrolase [Microbacterium sp. ASV49]MDL9979086.1 amidohydrolase [Microbacterium sp. ASV49]
MALTSTAIAAIDAAIAEHTDADVERFIDLHRHPELGFMEERTAAVVADRLRELGYSVTTGIGVTGVVGVLRNGDGPTVLYRADMDANAVAEASGRPYASTVRVVRPDGTESPVAHQCGHDAHVTWMLSMAQLLAERTDLWAGTAVLVGQPAEEPITGAKAMVEGGLYDIVPVPDQMIGMHTAPMPVGTLVCAGGTLMAGTDQLDVLIRGAGGHGSSPHRSKDPIAMAAEAIVQYQSIVARMIDPSATAVLTVGAIHAGADNNVIPDEALLKLNLRWFEPAVRERMLRGIHDVTDGIVRTYQVTDDRMPVYTMKGGSTPLVNTPALSTRLADAFAGALGELSVVRQFPAQLGSEDAHLLKGPHDDIDFTYLMVGVVDPDVFAEARVQGKDYPYTQHSPEFYVDLAAIPMGARIASYAMLELLGV